jgi:hypothetical protein
VKAWQNRRLESTAHIWEVDERSTVVALCSGGHNSARGEPNLCTPCCLRTDSAGQATDSYISSYWTRYTTSLLASTRTYRRGKRVRRATAWRISQTSSPSTRGRSPFPIAAFSRACFLPSSFALEPALRSIPSLALTAVLTLSAKCGGVAALLTWTARTGNTYSIENHTDKSARIFFAQGCLSTLEEEQEQ